jgi:prepilin-type processing-associated H-X9-DG protein
VQWQTHQEILNKVQLRELEHLTFKRNPSSESSDYNVLFADGHIRRCEVIFPAFLADWPEYSNLHYVERHVCFWCECATIQLGDHFSADKQHSWQDHNLYITLSDANTKPAAEELVPSHVH